MYTHNIIKRESWEISTWKGIIIGYHPQTGMTWLHGLRNTVCCTVHKFKLKLTKLKKPTVSVNMTQEQSFFPGSSFQMDWGNVENFSVVQQTNCEIIFRKHQWCNLQTKEGTRDRPPGIYSMHICTGFRPTYDPIHVTSFQGRPCTIQQFNNSTSLCICYNSMTVWTAHLVSTPSERQVKTN